jgi:hypothetical protein
MNALACRALAGVLLLAGCTSAAARQNLASRSERNVLTREQLAATNSDNLYDAIDKLRPEWLTSRGPTSATDPTPSQPSVFMNGQRLGRLDSLRQLRLLDVSQVRYWAAGEASARFGMGHPRGVIEVTRL